MSNLADITIAALAVALVCAGLIQLDKYLDRRKAVLDARARNQARPWRFK